MVRLACGNQTPLVARGLESIRPKALTNSEAAYSSGKLASGGIRRHCDVHTSLNALEVSSCMILQ